MKVLVTMCAVFTLTASLSESESLMTENLNHTDKSGGHQVNENVSRDYSLFPELFVEPYTLKNGLQSYLVHDSSVTDTTVSITVNSGSYADPDEVHGLAHFLEHLMLNTAIDID